MAWTDLTIPPAPVLNTVGTGAAARQLSAAGSRSVVALVYGEDRIAGLVLNVLPAAAGSSTLLVQLLWCYACDAVGVPKLNDQDLPTGSSVTTYTGSQTTPDAALVAAFAAQGITYSAALTGYAYSVVSLPIRSVGSAEFNFAAIIRGRRVYDPRKDSTAGGTGAHRLAVPSTWEWSENPSLCLADYSSNTVYGAGTPIDWTTVPAAANANDALVGIEPRRIVGVSFIKAVEATEAIETLRAYAGCWVLPGVNGVRLVPDAPGAAVASYSHDAGEIAAIQPLTLRDTSRAPTVVEVIYTDRSKLPWRDASAIAQLPGAGTTKPWRLSQVRLPGVARYSQALREATERLNKLTLCDMSTSVEVHDIGLRHEIGDIVQISHPLGLTAKPFRVVSPRRIGPGRWQLDLVEYDNGVYYSEVVTAPVVADTSWVSPAGPPAAVTGFTAVPDELGVLLRWNPNPEKDVTGYELRVGGTSWETALPLAGGIATVAAGNFYRWLQPASGTYTLRIKALDSEGLASATATVLTPTVTSTKLAGIQAGATVGAQWGVNIGGQPSDAAILNANVGAVNLVWEANSVQAGPGVYGNFLTYLKYPGFDPHSLKPGEQLTISAEVWQDGVSAAAGQYAALYLYCVRADGNWTSQAAITNSGQTSVGSRSSAYVTLPAADQMLTIAIGIYHQGGATNTAGSVYADRIQVERGAVATQYKRGQQPGATQNDVVYSSSAPAGPTERTLWIDTSVTPRTIKMWLGGAWVLAGTYVNGTAQLTDDAQLGLTALWSGIPGGSGKPADNAGRVVDLGDGTAFGSRNRNDLPSEYAARGMVRHQQFKQSSSIGLGGVAFYCTLETLTQYTNASGGRIIQYAYVDTLTYRRLGDMGSDTWTSWVQDLDRNAYTGDLAATRNQVYFQDSDPGGVPDGSIWVSSTRSWQRVGGVWRPYVGASSVGTGEIAPNAATDVLTAELVETSDLTATETHSQTWLTRTYTAPYDCVIEVTCTGISYIHSGYGLGGTSLAFDVSGRITSSPGDAWDFLSIYTSTLTNVVRTDVTPTEQAFVLTREFYLSAGQTVSISMQSYCLVGPSSGGNPEARLRRLRLKAMVIKR